MKVVLTIAGSDSSGGAGIQADLKTFEAFGLFGTSALTVLTAQNTTGVTDIQEVSPSFVKEQISAVLKDFDVAAIKIGMLYSKEIIEVVKGAIKDLKMPIVLDPVFISKAGSPLLKEDAVEAMKELFEFATVLTPNRYEAEALFGYEYGNDNSLKSITNAPTAVLVKNHVVDTVDGKVSLDQLFLGYKVVAIQTPYLETTNLHGTGCSYSSAITANIALGYSLEASIKRAKEFINLAIESAPNIGNGPGPINHKIAGEKSI
ncbi:bifunctional hydroxymethylpyrimidine kinase/phosphomethylpyrimidine kinase [Sulfurimonas sp.]|jgi:hydroxymethylpyrimidine/phosphomethylpyrimidine kinase|uniref:bifunctional hydroxymethylpyrimidine kinase/phosphomethylpyrimidine kinase n=1 Tax=Sulfurimonas sp. TaxID=2022749 RepID=UPI0025CE5D45|nr:bifunctional hydroxymethylpyrimidine kinase/phosphomethylpyrimidine kinase [Sulfurimonas sp.]MBT5934883.1 bifunctional hydroxymethylpyrimidine kinase/phosphomethylpyrimidine kinase [Sulfurimonas sp.]